MIDKTSKMRIGLLAAISLCATLCIANGDSPGNGEIRSLYSRKEDELVARFQNWEKLSRNEVAPMARRIGVIRTPKLTDAFLDLTDYNPFRRFLNEQFPGIDPVEAVTSPKIYGAGPNSPVKERCPFFEALLRIGVPFSKCVAHYEGKTRTDALFNLSCLAQISGGHYFNAYFPSVTNQWNSHTVDLISKVILREPLSRIIPTPDAHLDMTGEYDNWQKALADRFRQQLASGDAEIADTIYTMGFIRSDRAMPLLIDNLTVCPQVSTNAPSGFVFPAAEALISIWPPLGICFEKLEAAAPMSLDESLWLRITHEIYPEALEYDLMKKAEADDARARRLLQSLPRRRL